MNDLVSVIIPVYNAENSIIPCLDSVKNQNYNGSFEILIINDGSTDNSKTLIEKYIQDNPSLNIRLFNQINKGVSSARNVVLKQAKGEFIALLDADDIWLPKKTTTQINIIKYQPEIDFLACCRKNHVPKYPYLINKDLLSSITFKKLLFRNEAQPSTVIFRRKILNKIGYFNENQRYAEDVQYWLKISRNYKMYICSHQLVIAGNGKRTFGVSGLSANLKMMHRGFLSNLKFCLKRKWVTPLQYLLYYLFYKVKYLVLLIRSL